MSLAVSVDGLVKRWGTTTVVDDVSFAVPEASLTVLLGPSGCGKSTILRLIAGLEDPTEGRVRIGARDVTRVDASKRGVSMVFQSYALFPHLDVFENVVFGLKVRGVAKAELARRSARAIDMVGLEPYRDRKPSQLSGGQRQRVALARAIVAEQPVCLMDAPLSNLDAKLRATMRDEIRDLQQRLGLTMIYVTHDQTEAMSMADQVVLLREGCIEQIGSPADLYEKPASAFAARFIGLPPMNLLPAGTEGPARMGIRPEHLTLGPEGIAAEVAAVDYLGAETIVRLKTDDTVVMARVQGKTDLVAGTATRLSWRPEDAHFFDESGVRRDGL
ncbi:MAG: ABC transporter ATP-binding protein [Alphaproteobacteria bacterium]|nr:ABC transporter ATP-binding protein [Alphaproteobacteria bacterium]